MATKTSSTRARKPETPSNDLAAAPIIAWVAALMIWLFISASMISFSPGDWPSHGISPVNGPSETANWGRQVGAWISYELFSMLGIGAWIVLGGAAVQLGFSARRIRITHPAVRAVGILMVALALSAFHALFLPTATSFPEGAGGLVAIAGVDALHVRFGTFGATLWILLAAIVGMTIAFDRWLLWLPKAAGMASEHGVELARSAVFDRVLPAVKARAEARFGRANDLDDDPRIESDAALEQVARRERARRKQKVRIDDQAGGIGGAEDLEEETKPRKPLRRRDPEPEIEDIDDDFEDEIEEDAPGAPQVFDPNTLREKIAMLPVRFANSQKHAANEDDLEALRAQRRSEEEADRNYVFPGLDLLENPESNYNEEMEKYVREQAEALEAALHTYKISGEVVGIDSGPVITLYQVRLAPGTKVASVQAIASDVARSLRAINVRIVPNTEGLDTVGIEVPNRLKEKVRLKELMTSSDRIARMKLPLFLGKDASGDPLISDLAKLPHMLIAGTTGSGKSVCMNAIIMGFLYTQKPSDMKLVLVDPKMVEMSQFKDIPHLMCPVVTEMSKAAAILEWAVTKMDERYELLAEAGCRDISAYNGLGWEELRERFNPQNEIEEAKIPRKLPYMVFIIDELADLMMTNKEVESSIVRIAQKARAVGIHLILATQRPQANVVTGLIKSNMPGRLAFKVASGMDSRIVLDQKGGELLLGQGDMLMLTPQSSATLRAQGTLVEDTEIRRVVRFIRSVSEPSFERSLVTIRDNGFAAAEDHEERMRESAQEDPLFDRAVEIVLETRRGSVSLLQRRLAIGYTRASRLIELMGQAGIIGEHKGSVAREVTMTIEEWEAIKDQASADASDVIQDDTGQQRFFTEEDNAERNAELPEDACFDPTSIDVSLDAVEDSIEEEEAVEDEGAEVEAEATVTVRPTAPAASPSRPAEAEAEEALEAEEVADNESEAMTDDVTDEEECDEAESEDADDAEADDETEWELEYEEEDEDESEEDAEPEAEANDEDEWEYEYVEVDEDGEEVEMTDEDDDAPEDEDDVEDEYDETETAAEESPEIRVRESGQRERA